MDRQYKYGVVYLSYIPDGLTVKLLRDIMSQFGEVGRIYLEPETSNATSKRKKYVEGWIEFKKKRVAKQVSKELNGTELKFGKKHSILRGQIWSIKYLHNFKWRHLTEQLEMQKANKEQKRRFEMSQVKKQADFYRNMTERSRLTKKKPPQGSASNPTETKQNRPIEQGNELSVEVGSDLLSSIFKKIT